MYPKPGTKSTGSFLVLSLVPLIGNLKGRISKKFEKIYLKLLEEVLCPL